MGVPLPRRNDKYIVRLPGKLIGRNFGDAMTAEGVVNGRARVPMALCFFTGTQELNHTGKRRQGGTASMGVGILQQDPIVEIAGARFKRLEACVSLLPRITI